MANATANLVDAPLVLNVTSSPFLIPDETFALWYRTEYAYADNIFLSQTYGWIIIVTGCAIMLLAGLLRVMQSLSASLQTSSNGLVTAMRKHITVPALLNGSHAHRPGFLGLEFSIPTRLESLFLFVFIAVNLILTFTHFDIFAGNFYWAATIDQFNRYVADRTGILAIAQFPFLFAFAGRNTIFLWITGWSYESFSVFHKWVARTSVFHAFLHTIMYTVIYMKYGAAEYYEAFADAYFRWGVVAMIAGFMLVSGSVYTIRRLWYEVFLVTHIILAVVWLVGTFYHIKLLDEPQYMPWMWVAVAFWAFDRTVRILRLILINFITGRNDNNDSATDVIVLEDDVLRLEIPVANAWQSTPGQYIFVYFPKFKFWQSHPFTILDVANTDAASRRSSPSTTKQTTKISAVELDQLDEPGGAPGKKLVIAFRAHKGVTRQLLNAAVSNGGTLRTRSLVEGPYGSSHHLEYFDKVVLLAAGLGITACLPFLMQLVQNGATREQDIVLHWVVREEQSVEWLRADVTKALKLQREEKRVRVVYHVTGLHDEHAGSHKDIAMSIATSSANEPLVVYGRPVMQDMVRSEVEDGRVNSSVAVLSCGPGRFSDDCRRGVVRQLGVGQKSLVYFEESFNW